MTSSPRTTIPAPGAARFDPAVAHHFESPQQQFDAGKLGMWIFLATEVLFFGGLLVAYTVFRSTHPELFVGASRHLSKTLGAANTAVLIFSSLTMAWAVRSAQLGRRTALVWSLAVTLVCAAAFLGVKAVEYRVKWDEGLLWAGAYQPVAPEAFGSTPLSLFALPAWIGVVVFGLGAMVAKWTGRTRAASAGFALLVSSSAFLLAATGADRIAERELLSSHAEHSQADRADGSHEPAAAETATSDEPVDGMASGEVPMAAGAGEGVFFSIYFSMTLLHALHIVIGMGVIVWLLWAAAGGAFGPHRFAAVDFSGLYWHLVDLVWIFLFPMLYLIQ